MPAMQIMNLVLNSRLLGEERNLKRQEISSSQADFRYAMKLNKLKRDNSDFLQISSTWADSNAISESNATTA